MELLPIDLNIVADDEYIYLYNLDKANGEYTEIFKGRIVCAIRSDAVPIGGSSCSYCPLNNIKKSNNYVVACKLPQQAIGNILPSFRFSKDSVNGIELEPNYIETIYTYED